VRARCTAHDCTGNDGTATDDGCGTTDNRTRTANASRGDNGSYHRSYHCSDIGGNDRRDNSSDYSGDDSCYYGSHCGERWSDEYAASDADATPARCDGGTGRAAHSILARVDRRIASGGIAKIGRPI